MTELEDLEPQARRDRARTTGAALEAYYQFLLWLIPTVEGFPRSHKFLLGDRIQGIALDVLERLIEATYTRRRQGQLAGANLGLEKLRFLFRLARDLRILDHRRYEHAARVIDATGRRVGRSTGTHIAGTNIHCSISSVCPNSAHGRSGPGLPDLRFVDCSA